MNPEMLGSDRLMNSVGTNFGGSYSQDAALFGAHNLILVEFLADNFGSAGGGGCSGDVLGVR